MEMNRMERKPETDGQGNEQETRKPYHKPEVIVYGNIREITRNPAQKVISMEAAEPLLDLKQAIRTPHVI